MEKLAEKLHEIADEIHRSIKVVGKWMSEDEKDGDVFLKRLTLGEMVRSVPVEIQDRAIEALEKVINNHGTGGEVQHG